MSDAGCSMLGAGAWGWPREMLWGRMWEGGSCLGTHVRIKDLKLKKKKRHGWMLTPLKRHKLFRSRNSVAVQSMEGNATHLFGSSGTWNIWMFYAGMGRKWNAMKARKSLDPGGVFGVSSIWTIIMCVIAYVCCTPETNTILQINYTTFFFKKEDYKIRRKENLD